MHEQLTSQSSNPARRSPKTSSSFKIPVEWAHDEYMQLLLGGNHTYLDAVVCDGTEERRGKTDAYVHGVSKEVEALANIQLKVSSRCSRILCLIPIFLIDLEGGIAYWIHS